MVAPTTTLVQLRAQALDQADMTGSAFAVEARLNDYANIELSELYETIVKAWGDDFTVPYEFGINTTDESYDLPENFYKMRKVFYKQGRNRYRLRRFMMSDLGFDNEYVASIGTTLRSVRYRVLGQKIWFTPRPGLSGTIEIFYIPGFFRIHSDDEAISFPIQVGWEDVVISGMAARLLQREESLEAASLCLARKNQGIARIKSAAADRDAGEPHRVTDIRERFGYGWGYSYE
jgi:hypothetical protein